jgi:hypothetical protein
MTNLKAYVVSNSNDSILVANMTELEAKNAKIKALEDEVRDLTTRVKSLISELNKAETEA